MKTAAIYSRVSSAKQKEEKTIFSQIEELVEYAKKNDYMVPPEWIFKDEGYSGSILIRPELERLRDLVAEGEIEVVLVFSPDRLSRKYSYQVLLTEEFKRHGAEILFLKAPKASTPEEELMLQFQGMIAEYERAQIIERTRRGKKYKAKKGSVNVLAGAPYGYHYVKKSDCSDAYYEVIESEAKVVQSVYSLYTEKNNSIADIVRWLNEKEIPTRKGISIWERTTVWGMLRNPAYIGKACFGKTESTGQRVKKTRKLRLNGGYTSKMSDKERPREEWIEISVPAIISEETFTLVQERLEENKRFSRRHTIEPTLLQNILVCKECSYSYYRTSARISKGKVYYYRCPGSDNSRFSKGRICNSASIRQDYLDELVWKHVIEMLKDPNLIRTEINRRINDKKSSNPMIRRKSELVKELGSVRKGMDKLLDAYQEEIINITELRKRIPDLRKKESTIQGELESLEANELDEERYLLLTENLENFLNQIDSSAENLDVKEKQKVLRLIVKEILVGKDSLTIRHSIPIKKNMNLEKAPSYLLRSWSRDPSFGKGGWVDFGYY